MTKGSNCRQLVLLVILLASNILAYGQSCKISGNVLDTLGQPIEGAVVISMEPLDSVMVEFSSTNEKGFFKLGKFKKDSLLLQVSFLGFAPYYEIISCKGEDLNLQIEMKTEEMLLKTVVVTEERIPIKMNGDTVQYDARAFRVKPGDVTEDLLKKMPGIDVDEQGKVTAMGKPVNKILVDGKEFFGSDPKMATKNIPADAIKNVKVFDKKTDDEAFTKTDDGKEEITIDLELKEDKKMGGFGRVTINGGTQERYAAKGNYFRFSPKIKYSLIGMSNNTNQTGYSIDDLFDFNGGPGSLGSGGVFRIDDALPFANSNQDGLWQTHSGAGSFSYNSRRIELHTTFSGLEQTAVTNSETEIERFYNGGEKYFLNNNTKTNSNSGKYLGRVRLKYTIDSTQEVSLKGRYTTSFRKNKTGSNEQKQNGVYRLISQNEYHSATNKNSSPFFGKVVYRKRFRNKHSIVGSVDYRYNEQLDAQSTDDQSIFYGTDTTSISVYREINKGASGQKDKEYLAYTLPSFKDTKLKIWGSREFFVDKQLLANNLFNGLGFEKIDSLSGSYRRDVERYVTGFRQDVKIGKIKFDIGLAYEQSTIGGAVGDASFSGKKYFMLQPSLKWKKKISSASALHFSYRSLQKLPRLKEILPVVEVQNASYTYRGNPSLKPSKNHQFRLSYRNFDRFNGRNLYSGLNFSYYIDPIVYARTIDAFYRQEVMPVNTPSKSIISGYVYYQMKVPFLHAKVSTNLNGNMMKGMNVLNDEQFANVYKTYSSGLEIENSKKKIYDFGVKANVRVNNTESQSVSANNVSYSFIGHFSVVMPKGFEFDTKGVFWYYPDTRFDAFPKPGINWHLIKTFTESEKWSLGISGYDMLGRSNGYKQNAGSDQLRTTRTENIGRYFLLKLSYKI